MKNYKKIKSEIKKYFANEKKHIKKDSRVFDEKAWQQIDNPTEKQRALLLRRTEKKEASVLTALDRIAQAPELVEINIITEWVKSRTWGHNPHATARVITKDGGTIYTGKASGCGYDKYSAAVTEALNQSDSVKKAIIENLNKLKKAGRFPHSCYVWEVCGLPRLATSGSGISSLIHVFKDMGYKVHDNRESNRTDFLTIYK